MLPAGLLGKCLVTAPHIFLAQGRLSFPSPPVARRSIPPLPTTMPFQACGTFLYDQAPPSPALFLFSFETTTRHVAGLPRARCLPVKAVFYRPLPPSPYQTRRRAAPPPTRLYRPIAGQEEGVYSPRLEGRTFLPRTICSRSTRGFDYSVHPASRRRVMFLTLTMIPLCRGIAPSFFPYGSQIQPFDVHSVLSIRAVFTQIPLLPLTRFYRQELSQSILKVG